MICIMKLERQSSNTEKVPTGWIIAQSIEDAINEAEFIGDIAIANQLKRLSPNINHGRYNLSDNVTVLIS